MADRNIMPDLWRRGGSWSQPMREISRLQRNIDRMFDEFFTGPVSMISAPSRSLEGELPTMAPPCDIEESESHYMLSFDLPGVKKDDVKIEVRDNQLVVSGERKEEHREEKKNRLSEERFYGSFMRSFALPTNVDADKVEASYEDGVLRVAIPKSEAAKPKQIKVGEGKSGIFGKLLGKKEEKPGKAA